MAQPLMPHATASWLVDNTALTFEQIAAFCGLHILEVQAMADDLAGSKYTGRDPVHAGAEALQDLARDEARQGRQQEEQGECRPGLDPGGGAGERLEAHGARTTVGMLKRRSARAAPVPCG